MDEKSAVQVEIITIYATEWCWDCRRAKKFFDRRGIPYKWIDIDSDKEGESFVIDVNHGYRSVPTIVLPGGKILVEPGEKTLRENFPDETAPV